MRARLLYIQAVGLVSAASLNLESIPVEKRGVVVSEADNLSSLQLAGLGTFLASQTLDVLEAEVDRRTEFGPLVQYRTEIIGEGQEIVELGSRIYKGFESSVFFLNNTNDERVIKYQARCRTSDIHPLLRDFIFLKQIEGLGISPKAHFLSLPIKFTSDPVTEKTDFGMSQTERNSCASNPASSLRFMVMDAADISFDQYMRFAESQGTRVSVLEAVALIKGAIEAIVKLHNKRIIHGDVHYGNLVLLASNPRKIGLIDFGSAMHVSELRLLADLAREPFSYNHCFLSHWNLAGFRFSFRDDVFKAILAGAVLMNGSNYMRFCQSADIDTMYELKAKQFLFNFPGHPDVIETIPEIDSFEKDQIRAHLSAVLTLIRNVESLDDFPPFGEILDQLDAALIVLQTTRSLTISV